MDIHDTPFLDDAEALELLEALKQMTQRQRERFGVRELLPRELLDKVRSQRS